MEYKFKQTSKLSNYFLCDVFVFDKHYLSSEAAYQSAKSLNDFIMNKFVMLSPDDAKHFARYLESQGQIKDNWYQIRVDIMYQVCKAKFIQNADCRATLLKSGNKILIEDTTGWHDNFWGNCDCEKCKDIKGQNMLGNVLMKVRSELRNGK